MKKFLNKQKCKFKNFLYLLRRTLFSPFLGIKIPFSKNINFEPNVRVGSGTRLYDYGGIINVCTNTNICNNSKFIVGKDGYLYIGKNCLLGEQGIYNVFDDLILGNNVITADRVSFVTNIHLYNDISVAIKDQKSTHDKIIVGDGCWLGMNVTILPGTIIGKNCVVAAHSVVKGIFPDYCVIAGVPGRIVKKYNYTTNQWEKY